MNQLVPLGGEILVQQLCCSAVAWQWLMVVPFSAEIQSSRESTMYHLYQAKPQVPGVWNKRAGNSVANSGTNTLKSLVPLTGEGREGKMNKDGDRGNKA